MAAIPQFVLQLALALCHTVPPPALPRVPQVYKTVVEWRNLRSCKDQAVLDLKEEAKLATALAKVCVPGRQRHRQQGPPQVGLCHAQLHSKFASPQIHHYSQGLCTLDLSVLLSFCYPGLVLQRLLLVCSLCGKSQSI